MDVNAIANVDGGIFVTSDSKTATIGQQLVAQFENESRQHVGKFVKQDISPVINKSIGVSEYIITKNLSKEFRSYLPSIEEIEAELRGDDDE
jgi:hypothetical protein